jgi:hypothetical protein
MLGASLDVGAWNLELQRKERPALIIAEATLDVTSLVAYSFRLAGWWKSISLGRRLV